MKIAALRVLLASMCVLSYMKAYQIGYTLFFAPTVSANTNQISFYPEKLHIEQKLLPTHLTIPALGVELPAVQVSFSNELIVPQSGVAYDPEHTSLGTQGNTVMYGHNWNSILGQLHTLEAGNSIIIATQEQEFRYVVEHVITVDKNDTWIHDQTDTDQLTIYTCRGWFDQNRVVVLASPEKN